MKTPLHFVLGLALMTCSTVSAQQQYPIVLQIQGYAGGIGQTTATLTSQPGTLPNVQMAITLELEEGTYVSRVPLTMFSPTGVFTISQTCSGGTVLYTAPYNVLNTVAVPSLFHYNLPVCNTGSAVDCEGVLGGQANTGSACDDGDPDTYYDTWNGDCECVGGSADNFINVSGHVNDCFSGQHVALATFNGLQHPFLDFCDVLLNGDCDYSFSVYSPLEAGTFYMTTVCNLGTVMGSGNSPDQEWSPTAMSHVVDPVCGSCTACFTPAPNGPWGVSVTLCADPYLVVSNPTLDWGDGTVVSGAANLETHEYAAPGTYQVCLTANCYGLQDYTDQDCHTITVDANGNSTVVAQPMDCLGVPGGSAVIGSLCNDGNPLTNGDMYLPNCTCAGMVDGECFTWANLEQLIVDGAPVPYETVLEAATAGAQPITYSWYFGYPVSVLEGTSATPSWPRTFSAGESVAFRVVAVDANGCQSEFTNVEGLMSCDGILGSSAWPGLSCTDPVTGAAGIWSSDCECVTDPPCFACFTTTQSMGGGVLIPFQADLSNCTTGGTAPYTYSWQINNGTVSTNQVPVITFPTPGEYIICLNVVDANGTLCSDCDTVYVDANGTITPYPPCLACMTITQGIDGASIDPFVVEVITCTTGGSGNFAFAVDWGDGSTGSSLGEHTYAGPGVYDVCIVATGAAGEQCSRCTTIDIDAAGVVNTSDVGAPYSLSVRVDLQECDPGTMVRLRTLPGTLPAFDNEVELDQDCSYVQSYAMTSSSGWVEMTLLCDASFPTAALPYDFASNVGSLQFFHPGCTPDFPDCLGVNNGTALPGTPCENPVTNETGTWSAACVCVPNTTLPCEAEFFVMQAYEWVEEPGNPNGGGGEPIPNELWVWNLSSGGTGLFQFTWSFGDGTSSTEAFPSHTYASGEYELCLTVTDNAGCTDTFCDMVSVDSDGILNGLMGGEGSRNVFTIHVMDPLATGVNEKPAFTELATWPNPTENELNISLNSQLRGRARLTIMDLSGRTVMDENRMLTNGQNRLVLPVADLSAGLYLVQIGNGASTVSSRFVKVR